MPIATERKFRQFLQEQLEKIRVGGADLESVAAADNLDLLFQEFSLIRLDIGEAIKIYVDQLSFDQLVELQSQLNRELDKHLSVAIKAFIERQTQSLSEKALRDPLTLLFNRAAFDQRLRDEVERARRYGRNLSLILFDIDHFKTVNDRYGHTAGDQVLLQVAKILQESMRKSDATFRYGGDEFAAICPETSGEMMARVLGRIEISLKNYCAEAQIDGNIGISWGAGSYPADAVEAGELIDIADKRLYSCKRGHHQSLLLKS